jgi:uncharacterized protein (DUF2235 family)
MARKLVVLFDGTWNNERSHTSVTRMREAIASSGEDDPRQPMWYDSGVGTHWYDRFSGAAFGRGLSENIREGFRWLAKKYAEGDQIYVFGFSRGAYTARSLVGLIRKCGILRSADAPLVERAYQLYRDKDVAPDDARAAAFRAAESREARVRFIGVWDTVGALGVPVSHVPFSRDYYRWHDTELSKIVDYAYHAIAVDENREDYDVAVWTAIKPENIKVEQRWFVGAHANVGGGYPDDPLHTRPLRWMQDGAEGAGLALRGKAEAGPQDHLAGINDSFKEFMYGAYRLVKTRYWRSFGRGVNESVDEGVWRRWKDKPEYRPGSLERHPDRPLP